MKETEIEKRKKREREGEYSSAYNDVFNALSLGGRLTERETLGVREMEIDWRKRESIIELCE